MRRICLWISVFSMAGIGQCQTSLQSNPQAVALAAQSIATLTGGSAISDVTLSGSATRIAGSDQQSGNVTLLAKDFAESRVDMNLNGGSRSETRNTLNGFNQGNWIGVDGVAHAISLHNCFTDAAWFFPALGTVAAVAGNPKVVLSYMGLESSTQTPLQHIQAYTFNPNLTEAQQLSTMDFYLDSKTLLPSIVTFDEHPDNDQTVNISVAVVFSDYRNVSGAMIPFHIQRYVYNGLTLDIQLVSAGINSGIPDSLFNLQ
jgi:hypothetical protein